MNRRITFCLALVATLAAAGADAQFLGDALASAGLAVTEQQAAGVLAASGSINDPSLSTLPVQSSPPAIRTYTPETLPEEAAVKPGSRRPATPGQPQQQGTGGASTSTGTATTSTGASSSTPSSGAVSYAGAAAYAASIDPKAAAEWRDAFRPVGTKLAKAPAGAETLEVGGKSYSYAKGMFLQQADGGWAVVQAPPGAAVKEKPVGAVTVIGDGKPHTYYAGTFYVYDSAQKAYVVVAPPVGATVDYLPDTAAKVQWNGSVHYQYAGTYYKPLYRGSSIVYTVAGA